MPISKGWQKRVNPPGITDTSVLIDLSRFFASSDLCTEKSSKIIVCHISIKAIPNLLNPINQPLFRMANYEFTILISLGEDLAVLPLIFYQLAL